MDMRAPVEVGSTRCTKPALHTPTFTMFMGRAIVLGLELLVAADIIKSVGIDPTFVSVGVLALIVLVRTILSWALEVEIDGE